MAFSRYEYEGGCNCWFSSIKKKKKTTVPDTSRIDRTELSQEIKLDCGDNGNDKNNLSVVSKIQKRMISQPFTQGEKCFINNSFRGKKLCQSISIPSYNLWSGSFSEDGEIFVTVGTVDRLSERLNPQSCLWLYYLDYGKLRILKKIQEPVNNLCLTDIAFSPDGSLLCYAKCIGQIQLCSIYKYPGMYRAIQLDLPEKNQIYSLEFCEDGHEIFGISGSSIFVYNLEKAVQIPSIKAHSKKGRAIRFADETTQILFSAGNDGLCKVWDRRIWHETNPQPVGIFAGHQRAITFIDSRGDGRHLITTSDDETIKLWDTRAFSSAKDVKVSHRYFQGLRAMDDLKDDTSLMTYRTPDHGVTPTRCKFSPLETTGQRYIYAGSDGGICSIYDILSGQTVDVMRSYDQLPRDLSWHPYEPYLTTTSHRGSIELWITTASLDASS